MNELPKVGQRWISESDVELGLGLVVAVDDRTATLLFPAVEDSRIYSLRQLSIARIRFAPGDRIESIDGRSIVVDEVSEHQGILSYHGHERDGSRSTIIETRLIHQIHLARPEIRMLAGQVDELGWYDLRYDALNHQQKWLGQAFRGLIGPRIDLLPHQLYVAHEVGRRHAPRVLLADEVGLGKTIEAGLIIHRQLQDESIKRVLIVVPQALQIQWMVELLRRFQLRFSLMDKERLEAEEQSSGDNPFEQEQLMLISLDLLVGSAAVQNWLLDAGIDMLVVDEAHHLSWNEQKPSPAYQCVEQLAKRIPSVVLISATPEQLEPVGHFARLRLLDPDYFSSPEQMIKRQQELAPVADLAERLNDPDQEIDEVCQRLITQYLPEYVDQHSLPIAAHRQKWLDALLDRHSTGRVLFRNTRRNVAGFRTRHLNRHLFDRSIEEPFPRDRQSALLLLLQSLKNEKVLLITHHVEHAEDLEYFLRVQKGFRTSLFHEGMSLMERDRAAAYFAEHDQGAQIMICSEIGGEGRNFQFCHHLIMLDIPDDPNLIEQRIGRLDRIGQHQDIEIHVFIGKNIDQTPDAENRRLDWLHSGLDCFEHICQSASQLVQNLGPERDLCLHAPEAQWESFLEKTRQQRQSLDALMHEGQDRLLELSSCRRHMAESLSESLRSMDHDPGLRQFIERFFDHFGLDLEEHGDEDVWLLRPAEHRMMQALPGLDEEGMTLTWNRDKALIREDIQFLSWEHPLVRSCVDMLVSTELGNSSMAWIINPALPAGTILLEMLFLPDIPLPAALKALMNHHDGFIRILLDGEGRQLSDRVHHSTLRRQLRSMERSKARQLIHQNHLRIQERVAQASKLAAQKWQEQKLIMLASFEEHCVFEKNRLKALQAVNPSVREEEINYYDISIEKAQTSLNHVEPSLHAIRMMVAAPAS